MATKKEKDELLATLKFTPRTYKIELTGYGGEIVMGTVDRATFNYIQENNVDIDEMANDYDNELEIPEEHRFISDGNWYDCDNMCHESGVEFGNGCYVTVYDENGNEVWSSSLEPSDLEANGCEVSEFEDVYASSKPAGTVVFLGQSIEKGLFFGGEINLTQPFDHTKLSFSYGDYDGWCIGNMVSYDNEDIENNDYSTTGKSLEFSLFEVTAEGSEKYSAEELPLEEQNGGAGWPASYWPEESEEVTFKFKKHKPAHVGWYSANWNHGSTYGKLYWDGKEFVDFMYNKPQKIDQDGIVSWTGLNWDTSNWANCPQPEEKDTPSAAWPFGPEDETTEE